MQITASIRQIQKSGLRRDQCQDAYSPVRPNRRHPEQTTQTFAVTDGVTQSGFPRIWAKLVAEQFARAPWWTGEEFENVIDKLAPIWKAKVFSQSLTWFAEEKARKGSSCTFLGLEITDALSKEHCNYRWIAVGDTCLFHIQNDDLKTASPIKKAGDFGNLPMQITTVPSQNAFVLNSITVGNGVIKPRDSIWLMTDALACWFLREYEQGSKPWEELDNIINYRRHRNFYDWVEVKRMTGQLANDDVTVLHICGS